MIIGRNREIELLRNTIQDDKSHFIAVYGRRRIGKTFLIREAFDYRFTFQHAGLSDGGMKEQTLKEKMAKEEKAPLEIWKQALDNITPQVEVKSRRIGGATFQVPTEIRPDRKESVSMKNMINFARKRGGKSMADRLAAEIMDAYNNQGGAYKRKEDMHRMAEANRAFAHFRF